MLRNNQSQQQQYAVKPLLQRLKNESSSKLRSMSTVPQNFVEIDVLYEDIRKNLEALLNTRLRYINNLALYPELRKSLIKYGLNDFMHNYYGSTSMQTKLCEEIKYIVTYFEPRIANVNVSLQNSDDDISRILKIRIEGAVKALDNNIPAVFESSMDLNKHNFNVE